MKTGSFPKLKIRQTTWNLKLLYSSDTDPKMLKDRLNIEKESYKFINKWKVRSDYLEDPVVLKTALDEYEDWMKYFYTTGKEGYYFDRRSSLEQDNPLLKAKSTKIEDFGNKIFNNIQFFELRISKIPQDKQAIFLNFPKLNLYKHFLERLFSQAKFLLSEPEEKIMVLKSKSAYSNWVNMTSEFLSKEEAKILLEDGKTGIKPFAAIASLLSSKNKKTRESAALAFNQITKKHSDVAEYELNSILHNKKIDDELRGFVRPDEARHISDDIDSEVVDALLDSVTSRFDISSRYYKLKAGLMKVKKLKYHERNVEYGKVDISYSYPQAINQVYKVFLKLDTDFAHILERFVLNGQIDVFPKKGKTSGAFCTHNLITQPTYILLNFTGKLRDVMTLAHEMGHGINNELVRESQNALNFGTVLSTAEVASTFMEDFVLKDLLEGVDEQQKLAILMSKLGDEVNTIFRQVACYNFEKELHDQFRQKGYLEKKEIGKIFQSNMSKYMGGYVEQSEGSENWWVYWSHIRSFFYVYSYASGLLISKSLQNLVRLSPNDIVKVKEFLSAGTSKSPYEIFRATSLDIKNKKFWDKGINEIEELLVETEALAKKLNLF